jgi:uncharacterized protein YktA (UPF0223 family)
MIGLGQGHTWGGKFACACLLAAAFHGAAMETAVAGAKITVTYDAVRTEISPEQKTIRKPQTRSYILHGDNSLDFSGTGYRDSKHALGDEGASVEQDGENFTYSFHVSGGALIIISDYERYKTIRRIKTDGKEKCFCSLAFVKKNGFKNYEAIKRQGTEIYSEMHAENMTCAIEQTPD